jgi:hypothetical protein
LTNEKRDIGKTGLENATSMNYDEKVRINVTKYVDADEE